MNRPDSHSLHDPVYGLAVRALLQNGNGDVLLVRRSPGSRTNPGRWELPGGKVDDGERFDDALRREVLEETGLEIALDGPLGTVEQRLPGVRAVQLIMGGRVVAGELGLSDEHAASTWVPPDRFPDLDLADWFAEFLERNGRTIDELSRRPLP